jgi:RND family efflux transporter MFP subunit
MPPTPVELLTIAPHPVEQSSEFVGTVKSRLATTIQPQAEGFLTKILVKSGDHVRVGTPMFDIDSASQQALVANLESARAAREADVTLARQRADRAKALLAAGAGTQQDVEAAVSAQQTADAQMRAFDAQIRQQRNELSYYRVTAPAAGVIGDIPVRPGDRVTRSTKLTDIDSNAGLEIYLSVPVQEAPKLTLGLPVQVVRDAGEPTTEKITFIDPSVDDTTQTVLVKAAVVATKGLRTDQFVRARVIWNTAPMLTVPITAVLRISGAFFVYVATPARGGLVAKQQQVNLGTIIGNDYVLVSGLAAGDRLVVSGIQKIGDGAPIQPAGGSGAPGAPSPAGGK